MCLRQCVPLAEFTDLSCLNDMYIFYCNLFVGNNNKTQLQYKDPFCNSGPDQMSFSWTSCLFPCVFSSSIGLFVCIFARSSLCLSTWGHWLLHWCRSRPSFLTLPLHPADCTDGDDSGLGVLLKPAFHAPVIAFWQLNASLPGRVNPTTDYFDVILWLLFVFFSLYTKKSTCVT